MNCRNDLYDLSVPGCGALPVPLSSVTFFSFCALLCRFLVQIMGRMLEQNYQPTEAAFAIALMASGRLGKADFAKTLFAKRTAAGLEPKEEIYSSVSGLRGTRSRGRRGRGGGVYSCH